jgi:uncharacterized protein (DUF362 family)
MVLRAGELGRRDFIRVVTTGVALMPMLGKAGVAQAIGPKKSRVALVTATDRKQGVASVLKLMDLSGVRGKRVVIKPNFNSADDTPGSTHNDTLAQLVTELHNANARSVTLGESSGPPRTQGVMEKKGTFDLAKEHRFDVVDYEQIPESDWVKFPSNNWPDGFSLPKLVVDADYNVSTCCLKTHGFGGVFTMSLKLSVGLTPKPIRRTMHSSPAMRRMIAA